MVASFRPRLKARTNLKPTEGAGRQTFDGDALKRNVLLPLSIIARTSFNLRKGHGDGMERGLGGEVACRVNYLFLQGKQGMPG
jgi:hypothetical protein